MACQNVCRGFANTHPAPSRQPAASRVLQGSCRTVHCIISAIWQSCEHCVSPPNAHALYRSKHLLIMVTRHSHKNCIGPNSTGALGRRHETLPCLTQYLKQLKGLKTLARSLPNFNRDQGESVADPASPGLC
jgi:hypothetical protein